MKRVETFELKIRKRKKLKSPERRPLQQLNTQEQVNPTNVPYISMQRKKYLAAIKRRKLKEEENQRFFSLMRASYTEKLAELSEKVSKVNRMQGDMKRREKRNRRAGIISIKQDTKVNFNIPQTEEARLFSLVVKRTLTESIVSTKTAN